MNDSNHRVCRTGDLEHLNRVAADLGLNRVATDDFIASLDPNGWHIAHLWLFDHQAYDRTLPMHHRVQWFCKVKGSDDPHEAWIDVRDDDWQGLLTPTQAKAKAGS